tara:strand:- start:70 stop:975 length:906 start_codon:yes stop_codon:yes gene_type:complete
MNQNTKKVILIVGPTAIGKTQVSIEVAKTLQTDIISCDSRQFYKELEIGSAPPSKKELNEVKHHFIHNLSINDNYNAGKFEIDAINLIEKLHNTNDIIIVVGGSGLYVDAICKGFDKLPAISKQTREKITSDYKSKGLDWLKKQVKSIDPEKYSNYESNNPHRLLRALEVFKETGKNLSSFRSNTIKKRPFDIIKIGLNIERNILYERINKRVDIMMRNGLLEEANLLLNFQHKNALQTVGYKELFAFLNNECTLQEAIQNIKRNTRRFAKRQLTWFRKDKNIKWFKPNQLIEIKELISKL